MRRERRNIGGRKTCDEWLEMLALPSDDPCPDEFLEHMRVCHECRTAWNEYRNVWEALALDSDDVAVPDDLKEEVMQAVFGEEAANNDADRNRESAPQYTLPRGSTAERRQKVKRGNSPRFIRAAGYCLLALGLLAGLWKTVPHRSTTALPRPSQASTLPYDVAGSWKLISYSAQMPNASGKATLLSQGGEQKMIIEMTGMQPTSGEMAYQAWLLHDGERYNCGTFRVDSSGKGSLVYDIADPYLAIDGIGVTLEPDANGSVPRGPKIAGTPQSG